MATTTKLTSSGGFYGYESYSNSAANHLYIGAETAETKYDYRSRVAFPALSSIAAIGDSRISIRKILLYVRRNSGGPTAIHIGCSSSNAWNAALDAAVDTAIGDETGWYSVDVTAFARDVEGYTANWFIHFTGQTPRLRLDGTGKTGRPYLEITWEYAAATISGTPDEVTLGESVVYTIAPEVSGETHALEYAIGESSGTIVSKAGNSISWTPPKSLAAEITDDDTGTIEIHMTAYDASGAEQRTEVYYQTVRVPADVLPAVQSPGVSVLNGIQGYALTGRSALSVAPEIDMNGALGATIQSVTALVMDGANQHTITWSALAETAPGIFTAEAAQTPILTTPGFTQVHLSITDSRGRTVTAIHNTTTCAYALPKISVFSAERYEPAYDANEEITGYQPSDIGENVWINLSAEAISIAPNAVELNNLRWTIDAVSASGETLSASGSGGRILAIAKDRTLFPAAVSGDDSWQYTLTLTDAAGGIAYQYSTVLPGHVGFALGADKWAAAIGMIPTGNKSNPMFEVAKAYQARFYGGIWGANGIRLDGAAATEITVFSNSFAADGESNPVARRVGNLVELNGICTTTSTISGNATEHEMFVLPEGLRPATDVYQVCQGGTTRIWLLHINPAGQVLFSRYRNGSSYDSLSSGSTLMIHACWIAIV